MVAKQCHEGRWGMLSRGVRQSQEFLPATVHIFMKTDQSVSGMLLTWYTTSKLSFSVAAETLPKYSSSMSMNVCRNASANRGSTAWGISYIEPRELKTVHHRH